MKINNTTPIFFDPSTVHKRRQLRPALICRVSLRGFFLGRWPRLWSENDDNENGGDVVMTVQKSHGSADRGAKYLQWKSYQTLNRYAVQLSIEM